jgi:hypothetical protein
MADQTAEKLRIKPDDNSWYLLATLYGEPAFGDLELVARNRKAWNRYMAPAIEDGLRDRLIKSRTHTVEELTPFSPEERKDVQTGRGSFLATFG